MTLFKRRLAVVLLLASFVLLVGGDTSSLVKLDRFEFYLGKPILKPLKTLIKQADESITVGMYHIVNPKYPKSGQFIQALINAKNRGVNVRVAIERRDKWTRPTVKFFQKHNVNVRFYQADKTQHIKAIVVDEKFVFTGSQNISDKALTGKNWEAGVIFYSPGIASQLKQYLIQQR